MTSVLLRGREAVTTVYLDSCARRPRPPRRLYAATSSFTAPRRRAIALADFAMELIAEAFAPYAPREAQFHMPVEEWVAPVRVP